MCVFERIQNTLGYYPPQSEGDKFNPKMYMQKIVTLDGFGVRADPREHFVKNATLRIPDIYEAKIVKICNFWTF